MSSFEPAGTAADQVDAPATGQADEPADEQVDAPSPQAASPVSAALAELQRLPELELAEHPDAYQRIHVELQAALSAIDDA
jgi:hypothetical protein